MVLQRRTSSCNVCLFWMVIEARQGVLGCVIPLGSIVVPFRVTLSRLLISILFYFLGSWAGFLVNYAFQGVTEQPSYRTLNINHKGTTMEPMGRDLNMLEKSLLEVL